MINLIKKYIMTHKTVSPTFMVSLTVHFHRKFSLKTPPSGSELQHERTMGEREKEWERETEPTHFTANC